MIVMQKLLRRIVTPVAILGGGALLLLAPASASAAAKPHWAILSISAPAHFQAGDEDNFFEVYAINNGSSATDGSRITVEDSLPPEVSAISASGEVGKQVSPLHTYKLFSCPSDVMCETTAQVPPGEVAILKFHVAVGPNPASTLLNSVTISGGGAGPATDTRPTAVSSEPVPFGASTKIDASDGVLDGAAGSHPGSLTTILGFNVGYVKGAKTCTLLNEETPGCPYLTSNAKDLSVALPPGIVGNPTSLPQCPQASFQKEYGQSTCPVDTQVGEVDVVFSGSHNPPQVSPVYNIEPPPGQPAELGFGVAGFVKVPIFFKLRADGDYGLTAELSGITGADPILASILTIWGVPAAPVNDDFREGPECEKVGCPSGIANPKPFLTMPTSCPGTPLPLSISGDSWQNPLAEPFPTLDTTTLPAMTGCNQLSFEPSLQARPTTNVADSPSGLHVDLKVPQDNSNPGGGESPTGLATARLRDAVVTLPKGLTVNPASAAGLAGCSPAQFGLESPEGATPIRTTGAPAECPDASKFGTVEVDTPLLKEHNEAGEPTGPHPLPGSVYLAKPYDNPFKSLLALYVGVNDPETGIVIKLAGHVQMDPQTGQLTTTFAENPQLPFNDFKLDLFGGAKAPLRTPAVCGEYHTTSELTPWSAPESGGPATPSDSYLIQSGPGGRPCPANEAGEPNKPAFEAGTEKPLAGAYSPFNLHLHREDGTQVFSALNVNLPPGLIGKLAGVGECSDAQLAAAAAKSGAAEQASPSCPASSKIGSVDVAAGAGPAPYYTSGTAYLSGPYKGAPLSVAIITPALAGPFDLGTVVVRNALQVNPETAQISVKSDPIPTELQGIQLDVRSIDLKLDRNQFTLNPTNCEKQSFTGEEISSLGNAAALANPFQVGECGALAFAPKLALKLTGPTKRNKNPALRATLTMPPGGANIARAQVTLPHSEFLDQAHIQTVCTRVQFAANACPAASIYGHATAVTPLLDQPLSGPVYLRSSSNKLPDLVAALNGQINVVLDGRVDTGRGGGIRNSFEVVPDAPVSKFVLSMQGGKQGLLVNSENLCSPKAKTHAIADFVGQNGKVYDTTPVVQNSCKKSGKGKKNHKGHRHKGAHK